MTGPQQQFESLVQAYAADLYRYALWLCRDTQIAEDLVQETFMRAWKSLASLKDPNAAKSWLITILRRENARRFERVQPPVESLQDLDLERAMGFDNDIGHADRLMLRQSLASLAAHYREPLLLQVLGGYTCEEIAEFMGISTGAVMTRLFRARQQLRKQLGDADMNPLVESGLES